MSDLRSCSATDYQNGSDQGWTSSKTTEVFRKKKKICKLLTIETRISNVRSPTSVHSRRWRRHRRSRHWSVPSKTPGCCLMVAAALMILFSINWGRVNQVFHVRRIFNSGNSHVWPEANRILNLFTATNSVLRSTFGRALCLTFDWVLLVTPTALCTDLLGVPGGKATRNMWSSTTGLWLTAHVRFENIPPPLKTIAGSDEVGL